MLIKGGPGKGDYYSRSWDDGSEKSLTKSLKTLYFNENFVLNF